MCFVLLTINIKIWGKIVCLYRPITLLIDQTYCHWAGPPVQISTWGGGDSCVTHEKVEGGEGLVGAGEVLILIW